MIPYDLYRLLQCPTCHSCDLFVLDDGVHCAVCHSFYPRCEGYLDLMPRGIDFDYTSKYVSEEADLADELDYRELAPPLLAAGARNRTLLRLLQLRPTDIVLDNGCGTAKFAAWNADRVRLMVGSDPATLFADAAVAEVGLTKADSRRLPFADNSFDKSFSVDVLEHFPRNVIDDYLAETARVLKPGGRFLAFSNTSDPSSLQPIVNLSRRLGRLFVRLGVYDFQREARRKSDHIKALSTWKDVLDAMYQAGLRPVRIVFWNSVFTSFVEHVLMKLGEAAFGRQKTLQQIPEAEMQTTAEGTDREIRARQRIRGRLEKRGSMYYALFAVTLLMELDLWLFGHMRSGSYFIVVEKVADAANASDIEQFEKNSHSV
ncbi:MAG: class I SAM-dependent methyltransferase [Chloroflexi bacterium AL-W]|nr:class I SAM-dependent methyltransferase [Chloroflexi bacterium AL-N1]NOK67846.1 class I SAM-dependent methyltransferase [Chloroflexi bacterium AL-N10]NOK75385.1 class I SAM-dependent methyltransferase [Chloroflexi bacterium AL-N5]NOK82173.1 class I SAM-dependent methyltransferase [Chloroflexi bacterium AL-W]NOK90018.1 class I SAM-dependent methyltransferase [Chloroflexi bacterium AL-N15]